MVLKCLSHEAMRALAWPLNRYMFRHSSWNSPLKLYLSRFCHGLPGSMIAV
jgi:hypothetical protein